MLILLTAIWGLTFSATKTALAVTDPLHFLALRFGLASILLTPFIFHHYHHHHHRHSFYLQSLSVGVLLFVSYVFQTVGLGMTTASRSAFLTGLLVIIVPLLVLLFRTSRAGWGTYAAAPVSLFGVWLLAEPQSGGLNKGDVLSILCAFAFALQMIALEWMLKTPKSRFQIHNSTLLLVYIQIVVVALGAAVWSFIAGRPLRIAPEGLAGLGYNVVFGALMAVYLQTRYQPLVPAGHAALVFSLEPVFAALFAALIMGDRWTPRGFAGAGVILTAMALASLSSKDEISRKDAKALN